MLVVLETVLSCDTRTRTNRPSTIDHREGMEWEIVRVSLQKQSITTH